MRTTIAKRSLFERVLVLPPLLLACSSNDDLPDGTETPIEIGLLASITGELAGNGEDFKDATVLAFDEINKNGGVLGRQLTLNLQDNATSASATSVGYSALLDRNVAAILGPNFSSGVREVEGQIRAGRTLTIGQSTTSDSLTDLNDDGFFFRVIPTDRIQARTLASLLEQSGVEHLCLVHLNDAYGNGLSAELTTNVTDTIEGSSIIDVPYKRTDEDFSEALAPCSELPALGAKAGIVFITFVQDGKELVQQALKQGWVCQNEENPDGQPFFFSDGGTDEGLLSLLGSDADRIEGALGTSFSGPGKDTPEGEELRNFEKVFEDYFDRPPNIQTFSAYDAAYVAAMAIQIAGTEGDSERVVEAMGSIGTGTDIVRVGDWQGITSAIAQSGKVDFRAASGKLSFDMASGDVLPPYYVTVWKVLNGEFQEDSVQSVE